MLKQNERFFYLTSQLLAHFKPSKLNQCCGKKLLKIRPPDTGVVAALPNMEWWVGEDSVHPGQTEQGQHQVQAPHNHHVPVVRCPYRVIQYIRFRHPTTIMSQWYAVPIGSYSISGSGTPPPSCPSGTQSLGSYGTLKFNSWTDKGTR